MKGVGGGDGGDGGGVGGGRGFVFGSAYSTTHSTSTHALARTCTDEHAHTCTPAQACTLTCTHARFARTRTEGTGLARGTTHVRDFTRVSRRREADGPHTQVHSRCTASCVPRAPHASEAHCVHASEHSTPRCAYCSANYFPFHSGSEPQIRARVSSLRSRRVAAAPHARPPPVRRPPLA